MKVLYNYFVAEEGSGSPIFSSIFPKRLSKGDRKKLEIVEAAIGLVATKGIEGTSYDDIAQVLKTNRSHINYHFKERTELTLAVIRFMMSAGHDFTFARLREAQNAKQQLLKYLDGFCFFFAESPQYVPVFLYFYYGSGLPGEIRDLQTQVRLQAHARISELVRNIFFEMSKPAPKDLSDIAFQVQAQLLGGMIFNIATLEPANPSKTRATVEQITQAIEKIIKVKLN